MVRFVDGFCAYEVVALGEAANSTLTARAFEERWSATFGAPDEVAVGAGAEFRGRFEDVCDLFSIRVNILPPSA
eukprot:9971026-Alexandrium_andersonii.AAC.1